jgi:hypothetical protein
VRLVFVGERPSPLAHERGATWQNGRHAGRTLREALLAAGHDPEAQLYFNLWDGPEKTATDQLHEEAILKCLWELARVGYTVVGMGDLVCRVLRKRELPHVQMIHPAARGRIRRRDVYQAHVRETLEAIHAQAA